MIIQYSEHQLIIILIILDILSLRKDKQQYLKENGVILRTASTRVGKF